MATMFACLMWQEYEVDYDNHDNYCRNCGQELSWEGAGNDKA